MTALQVRLLGIMALVALAFPTVAEPADKAGWSVHTDPRNVRSWFTCL
jgi:hypothetical protein